MKNIIDQLFETKSLKLTDKQYLLATSSSYMLIDDTNNDQKVLCSIDADLVTFDEQKRTLFVM